MSSSVLKPSTETETTLFGSVPSSADTYGNEHDKISRALNALENTEINGKATQLRNDSTKTFEFIHVKNEIDNEVMAVNNQINIANNNNNNLVYNHGNGMTKDAAVIDMGEENTQ